jgi:hypothetical protein
MSSATPVMQRDRFTLESRNTLGIVAERFR